MSSLYNKRMFVYGRVVKLIIRYFKEDMKCTEHFRQQLLIHLQYYIDRCDNHDDFYLLILFSRLHGFPKIQLTDTTNFIFTLEN